MTVPFVLQLRPRQRHPAILLVNLEQVPTNRWVSLARAAAFSRLERSEHLYVQRQRETLVVSQALAYHKEKLTEALFIGVTWDELASAILHSMPKSLKGQVSVNGKLVQQCYLNLLHFPNV